MQWRPRVKTAAGRSGLLWISAIVLAIAAPPALQADTPKAAAPAGTTEALPPGALVFRGPNAGSSARAAAGTNASGASAVVAASFRLPPDLAEVVRLESSGMDEQALLAFVQNSPPFTPLTPAQIIYLKDLGVTPSVLNALLEHQQQGPGEISAPDMSVPQYPEASAAPENPSEEMLAEQGASAAPGEEESTAALPGPGDINPVDYGYVYGALQPYGAWLNMPGLGWCWRPTIESICHDWRPYCDGGQWRWTDCGWYWNSNYTWGGVPFHYGRWWQDSKHGWLWHPDHTWGPAWVAWRGSPGVSGWAPLPPGADFSMSRGWTFRGRPADPVRGGFGLSAASFTFVGSEHFQHPSGHHLGKRQSQEAFRQTAPAVGNGFVFGANQRLVNAGIDPFPAGTASREAAPPAAVTFPGGASFTATPTGGQLPFNLHKKAQRTADARGASALPSEEPLHGSSGSAGDSGDNTEARAGHVPQYPATRPPAEASSPTPKAHSQPMAGAAPPPPTRGKAGAASSAPPAGGAVVFPFGKPGALAAPSPAAAGHR